MASRFELKVPVNLDPPKDDPIPKDYLAKCNGTDGYPCYVAIKGRVFDVSARESYLPGGTYAVFAGKEASRALGLSSTKTEDMRPEWYDLPDEKKKVLDDWMAYFLKRYNIVGVVEGATNL